MYLKPRRLKIRRRPPIFGIFFTLALISITYLYIYLLANPITQTFIYPLTSEPIANPLMGWAPWASIRESAQPHSLVYADLTWREFEPQQGVYNFENFELSKQIARWQDEGKRIVFRFVLDEPGTESHMDIPDWLYEKIDQDGDFYSNSYGSGFSPNYANPMLMDYHRQAVAALGDRYRQSDLIAYIELGSLGHWGEWHVDLDTGIRPLPFETIRDQYVQHYLDAFPNTHLLMRRPFSIAARENLGLYNDMTAELSATTTWLDWIMHGGEYNQTAEINGLVPMPDGWKVAPIGGEQTTGMDLGEIYGQYLDQTLQLLKQSHTTFIGPGSPTDPADSRDYQVQIDQVLSTIGYRLYIDQLHMPVSVHFCDSIHGKFTLGNQGIAPIYYNWPTKIYLFDKDGVRVLSQQVSVDLRKVLPGELMNADFSISLSPLQDGTYTLGMAIVDPRTTQPAVKFAMKYNRPDLIFELGSFEFTRAGVGKWFSFVPGVCK